MKGIIISALIIMINLTTLAFAQTEEEQITLTTYYPAPSGEYGNLSVRDGIHINKNYTPGVISDGIIVEYSGETLTPTSPTILFKQNQYPAKQVRMGSNGSALTVDATEDSWNSSKWVASFGYNSSSLNTNLTVEGLIRPGRYEVGTAYEPPAASSSNEGGIYYDIGKDKLMASTTLDGANYTWQPVSFRIIRGTIDGDNGTIVVGSGFTIAKTSTGRYTITFDTAFTSTPVVVASPDTTIETNIYAVGVYNTSTSSFNVKINNSTGNSADERFSFIAIEQ
jgi:hypothetical protein